MVHRFLLEWAKQDYINGGTRIPNFNLEKENEHLEKLNAEFIRLYKLWYKKDVVFKIESLKFTITDDYSFLNQEPVLAIRILLSVDTEMKLLQYKSFLNLIVSNYFKSLCQTFIFFPLNSL